MTQKKSSLTVILVVAVLIIAAIIALSSSMFVSVPTGHTGVLVTFGRVEDKIISEGIHIKLPWQTVVKMDNRTQKASVSLQAFSSDIQQVDVTCVVNFSVDRETSQNLYRNVGEYYYSTVMEPRINENLKAIFAKYSADNLITNRNTLSDQILEKLKPEMKEYGIEVISVSVENIDFTDVFTDAVEAKQVAEQSKLQAEIEQAQKIMEEKSAAERQVISAEAAAEVQKIEADAEAYRVEVQAKAEAEANEIIAKSLTEELLKYNEITAWDGALPKIYGAQGVMPILNSSLDEVGGTN